MCAGSNRFSSAARVSAPGSRLEINSKVATASSGCIHQTVRCSEMCGKIFNFDLAVAMHRVDERFGGGQWHIGIKITLQLRGE